MLAARVKRFFVKPVLRCLPVVGSLLGALLLSGCLSPPGMTIRTSRNFDELGGVAIPQWLRAYEPVSDAAGKYIEPGQQAKAVIVPITPDLLRLQKVFAPPDTGAEIRALFGAPPPYTIGAGDVLAITVWDHPEIQPRATTVTTDASGVLGVLGIPGYNVGVDGQVQFPYVGTFNVLGLTELQARDKLAAELGRYFKEPQITLQVQAYRSGRIYVEGEVKTPGLQAINDVATTLPVALGRAGSLLATADRSAVTLTRNGRTTRIDLLKLTEQGIDPARIALRNGDVVRVLPRDDFRIYVLGEVPKVGPQLLRNGKLTLSEALGDAGGVAPTTGDPRQIYVVRNGATGNAEVYHLDANTVATYALAEGFQLQSRDVVFVDPVPLVNFNRVISLIIPSAAAVVVTQQATE
ncbi:MAG: sugar transporter [Comamonadaceae bacterium]|nr:MAG: sugar transporter [Comamonadaceae bacterium]